MQQQSTEKEIRDNVAQYLEIEEKNYNLLKNFEMDNYQELFTQAIEEQKNSAKIIDASFNKFKLKSQEMDATSLGKSFAKFQTELKMWTLSKMALSNSIIERKKNDFLEGGFFNEKRGEKFCSIVSANLPASHVKAVEELKNLQNKIVDERKLGNFPMKDIDEHEKLLRKAHNELSNFVYFKMDRNSESTKKLKRSLVEFEKFTKFPTFIIPGSYNVDTSGKLGNDISRDAIGGSDPLSQNHTKGPGLPPKQDAPRIGGYDFLFYGTIAVLTLLAGRYISKQLNAKTKEKPVEKESVDASQNDIKTFPPQKIEVVSKTDEEKKIIVLKGDINSAMGDINRLKETIYDSNVKNTAKQRPMVEINSKFGSMRIYLKDLDTLIQGEPGDAIKGSDRDITALLRYSIEFSKITKDPQDETALEALGRKYPAEYNRLKNPDPNPGKPAINKGDPSLGKPGDNSTSPLGR